MNQSHASEIQIIPTPLLLMLMVAGGWLLILCVVETTFTHVLDKHFAINDVHGEHEPLTSGAESSFYTG